MDEIIKKTIKELNQEGKLNGTKITKSGKKEIERILKQDKGCRKIVFKILWKKLENDFYETEPKEFALKVLALEIMLKNSGISLAEEVEKLIEMKGGKSK